MTADLDNLDEKTAPARSRDRMAIAARNAAVEVVLTDLRSYAGYVQTASGNNLTTLISSGFQATKTPARRGIPPAPIDLRVSYNGTSGGGWPEYPLLVRP